MSKRLPPKPPGLSRAYIEDMRETMLDLDATIAAVDSVLDRTDEPFNRFVKTLCHSSLSTVAAMAQSPIERLMFTSLVVGSTFADPASVIVLQTWDNALAQVKQYQQNCQTLRAIGAQAKRRGQSRREFILEGADNGVPPAEIEWLLTQDIGNLISDDAFNVILQAPIPEKRMRLDALVFVPARPGFLVAVECDGYEWHGNKDTFTADRKRDRELRTIGCEVVRFSGSEIHANPMEASIGLANYLVNAYKRHKKPRKWVFPEADA